MNTFFFSRDSKDDDYDDVFQSHQTESRYWGCTLTKSIGVRMTAWKSGVIGTS